MTIGRAGYLGPHSQIYSKWPTGKGTITYNRVFNAVILYLQSLTVCGIYGYISDYHDAYGNCMSGKEEYPVI